MSLKQFIYLDNDIVNSIIAQSENGFITDISTETETEDEKKTQKEGGTQISGTAGGSILKLAKAEATLDIEGKIGSENAHRSSSRELINKTLHDAAFSIAYADVKPRTVSFNDKDEGTYGDYIEIKRVFDFVDFDFLSNMFAKGGIIDFIKKLFIICKYCENNCEKRD